MVNHPCQQLKFSMTYPSVQFFESENLYERTTAFRRKKDKVVLNKSCQNNACILFVCIYPTPSPRTRCDTKLIFLLRYYWFKFSFPSTLVDLPRLKSLVFSTLYQKENIWIHTFLKKKKNIFTN